MGKIAVIGSNMVDLITYIDRMPDQGETLEAPGFALGCGGKGANQAVAAAKLGAQVLMLSKVGDDMFADNTLANFQRFGIDTRYVQRVPGVSSGVAPIFVRADSHNSILIVKGANAHLLPADIETAAADLRECTLIVLQLEINLDTVYYAIEFAHRHGIAVLLNPAPAMAGLSAEHLAKLDFLIPNESELALITGQTVDSPESARAAAKTLVASGVRHVIVTLGEHGALIWQRGTLTVQHVASPRIRAIDTLNAGDIWHGTYAYGLAHGWTLDKRVHAANIAAAMKCEVFGGHLGAPRMEQLLARLSVERQALLSGR